ncbi:Thioesterase/thiol ester dehydrase-isomerase [Neoconidiobolus thromboides FSU 785]|nr:Thioesterase/thiol ester dehydrase-isomerase [Neoconidiobolus thromboides FSU 785]
MSENPIVNKVQSVVEHFRKNCGYSSTIIPKYFQTIEAEEGRVVQEFIVEKKHLNLGQSLHGGFIGYLIDNGGAYAVMTLPKGKFGVSTDINISYLAGAKVGEKVKVESKVEKFGRSLAFTAVEISRQDENNKKVIIALGRHTVFFKNGNGDKSKL